MNWRLTVFNEKLAWYRVLGDDIDHLESEKRRARDQGFDYETEIQKCDDDENWVNANHETCSLKG